jgi:SAM-dependent methyltransferase
VKNWALQVVVRRFGSYTERMRHLQYTAARQLALASGMWFVWPSDASDPRQYRGWVIPPHGIPTPFRILVDQRDIAITDLSTAEIPALRDLFTRCGIAETTGLIFAFEIDLIARFPQQHTIEIRFDYGAPGRLLPFYASQSEIRIPPAANMYRVVHNSDPHIFRYLGQNDCGRFAQIFVAHSKSVDSPRILDWGCGCGRISSHMAEMFHGGVVSGVDVDAVNVNWLHETCSSADYLLIQPTPPLPFTSSTFDFVYGLSVMTHLSAEHQKEWLCELRRVIKKGGILLLTFHALPHFFAEVNDGTLLQVLVDQGFLDCGANDETGNSHYRNVFNTEEYIRRLCSDFEIVDYFAGAIRSHDLIVLRT